ncbi:hypothetical protein MTO96_024663 [Rhipicephalus appendiculatus]
MGPARFLKYLDSGEFADVEFLVFPEQFPVTRTFKAHKQFLAMVNEVFATMFFGSLPEKDQVIVTDIHPDGYFYGGKPRFRGIEDAMYTRTAAVKYMATDLQRICSEYIVSHISARNVCRLIDYASMSDGGLIDDAVLSVLRHDGVAVVCSDDFNDALDGHGREIKTVMKPFMPLLRFLALTPQEFIVGPSSWRIFDGRDDFAILCNLVCFGSVPLPQWMCSLRYHR